MQFNWGVLVPLLAIGGWVAMVLYRMHLTGRAREQMHRERLAMIEKGIAPTPEADPRQFERMMDWHPSRSWGFDRSRHNRRTGILLVFVGAALGAAGYLSGGRSSFSVMALLVVLGLGFLVLSMTDTGSPRNDPPPQDKP